MQAHNVTDAKKYKWGEFMRFRAWFLFLLPVCGGVQAFEFDTFGITGSLRSRVSTGIAVRLEEPDINLISKQAVPGQKNLCPDTCISINNDPEPNLRLVRAAGAFSGVNADDGVLNYDQFDIVAATNKLTTDLSINWKDVLFRVKGVGYYDPLNHNYDERHPDDKYQPATSTRPDSISRDFAFGANLLDAYIQYSFEFGERRGSLSMGQQTVRWGESTLVALNSIAEINPPNAALFRMPGVDIGEIFQPVPVILLSTDIFEGLTTEIVYQFGWKPVVPDPRGSFFADSDLIGGTYAMISLGQFGEDPFRKRKGAWPVQHHRCRFQHQRDHLPVAAQRTQKRRTVRISPELFRQGFERRHGVWTLLSQLPQPLSVRGDVRHQRLLRTRLAQCRRRGR